MMLRIRKAEDFGLGFNCMTRLYMERYDEKILQDIPSTCRRFVKANMEIMSDEALTDIMEYLKKRNANILKEESTIDKIDSDNWICMQEDLEAELLTRQMFYVTQEKAGNNRELKKLLNELLDLNFLRTQKDCLHMYHQVMGIERYLLAMPDDVNVKRLLKQAEQAKKAIGDKRVEFFEKEEGYLYEKIGEGVYRRK